MRKNGASLLISIAICFFLLLASIALQQSILRSLERNSAIERSNQVFFATESGNEAAIFHHNLHGAGVDFSGEHDSQKISHPEIFAEIEWKILGRKNSPIYELVRENQIIEIPFFWKTATDPHAAISEFQKNSSQNFELIFYNSAAGQNIKNNFADFPEIPANFDFDKNGSQILISWSVSREKNSKIETFVPTGNLNCNEIPGFFCDRNDFNFAISSDDSSIDGKILPCDAADCATNLQTFFADANAQKFKLSFRPILKFENSSGEKISAIPFSLKFTESTSLKIPSHSYKIETKISMGNFEKTIEKTVAEKTSVGLFDHIILD